MPSCHRRHRRWNGPMISIISWMAAVRIARRGRRRDNLMSFLLIARLKHPTYSRLLLLRPLHDEAGPRHQSMAGLTTSHPRPLLRHHPPCQSSSPYPLVQLQAARRRSRLHHCTRLLIYHISRTIGSRHIHVLNHQPLVKLHRHRTIDPWRYRLRLHRLQHHRLQRCRCLILMFRRRRRRCRHYWVQ